MSAPSPPPSPSPSSRPSRPHPPWTVRLIAADKLLKGCLLIIGGILIIRLGHQALHDSFAAWVHAIRVDPYNEYIHTLLERLLALNPQTLRELSVGTFLYAGLYFVEGLGLLFDKTWAEWVTIISTAGFIPVEIFEVLHQPSLPRITIFVINVLIVIYLIIRLWQKHRARHPRRPSSLPPS